MKKIQLFLLLFLLISITQHINAQFPVKTEYTVEMGGTSGKGTYAPMWLTANRQGLSSSPPHSSSNRPMQTLATDG